VGAAPSIGLPDLVSLTNRGHQSAKGYPILGRCFRLFPFQKFAALERAGSGTIPDPASASG
jgi:hypothetical protein